MERLVTMCRRKPTASRQPQPLPLLLLLLLLTAVALSSGCDVRNELRGPARKTQHAPVVFTGRVRSRGAERHGMYQVTVDVETVVKGDATVGSTLRLKFRRPAEDGADAANVAGVAGAAGRRRPACVAEAVVETGERYIVFAKPVGGPRNFTAVAAPEKYSRRNVRKVMRAQRKRRGRSPPRVAEMKNTRLPAGRRLRLQCRVRGAPLPRVTWFKNGKPINATKRIRIKMRKKKRRLQSQLIIRRVVPSDSGGYECRARNRVGKDAKRTRVSVGRRRRTRPTTRRPRPTGPDKPRPPDSWRAPESCNMASYCLNGGTCMLYRSVMEYVCQCAEGFKGKRCERKTVLAIKHHQGVDPHSETVRSPWQQTKLRNRRRRQRRR